MAEARAATEQPCQVHPEYNAEKHPSGLVRNKDPFCTCYALWAKRARERWQTIGVARKATPTRNRRGGA